MVEPRGVRRVGSVEGDAALGADLAGGAVVDRGRGVQPDPGVAVDVVVVLEERRAEASRISDRPKPGRERRAVLQRLELRLGEGVVVADMRARMAARDW